ncbi:MAG: hypothetical protein J6W58_09170 [Lachnospiraceae bacterium]|nr:hypothetical protein [Lachnospiraceae bacterium]MBP5415816.1 hypothetical protein [Lachnospiraceae bacterium]MBP5746453.1 hypothetical protein [Lachnospiraceae bacterium]
MIYEFDKMRLMTVSTKSIGEVNDCYICRDLASDGGILYTVILVHDHHVVRQLLELFKMSERTGEGVLISEFAYGEKEILVFPYHKERPLSEFYSGETLSLAQCEEVCISTLLACISCNLPYPILYLLLTGGQLHMTSDGSVYFGYEMDLSKLDCEIGESECTGVCAKLLLTLLEPKAGQKATSYYLLSKKTANGSYDRFTDLYRDVTIAAVSPEKLTLLTRFRMWLDRNTDRILGILFWISLILGIVALSILLSRIFLGGNSWLRLIYNTFKQIGTESLLQ